MSRSATPAPPGRAERFARDLPGCLVLDPIEENSALVESPRGATIGRRDGTAGLGPL